MNWNYKNGEVLKELSDFPENTFGFVYIITHTPTGKSYIGKKVLYHNKKVKLTKKDLALYENSKGRKPTYKRVTKESDWKSYWGSNKSLLELVKNEPNENFTKQILAFANTKKLLTYYETKYLFIYQVLEKPDEFFNDNILGKFFSKDLEE